MQFNPFFYFLSLQATTYAILGSRLGAPPAWSSFRKWWQCSRGSRAAVLAILGIRNNSALVIILTLLTSSPLKLHPPWNCEYRALSQAHYIVPLPVAVLAKYNKHKHPTLSRIYRSNTIFGGNNYSFFLLHYTISYLSLSYCAVLRALSNLING